MTGNSDGTLSQYKPDLTPAKMIPAPNLFESAPVEALAIYWISTFQFAVVYKNATDNSRPGKEEYRLGFLYMKLSSYFLYYWKMIF